LKPTINQYVDFISPSNIGVNNISLKLFPNMKHFIAITLCVLTSLSAFSQMYETQPQEVQAKMDLNKINGESIWKGIISTYNVSVQGLTSESLVTLQERAQSDSRIISFNVETSGVLVFKCEGGTPFEVVKALLSSLITGIVSFEEKGSLKVNSNE
jgi:hypothetical protein